VGEGRVRVVANGWMLLARFTLSFEVSPLFAVGIIRENTNPYILHNQISVALFQAVGCSRIS
jgi:hypothetical protein